MYVPMFSLTFLDIYEKIILKYKSKFIKMVKQFNNGTKKDCLEYSIRDK